MAVTLFAADGFSQSKFSGLNFENKTGVLSGKIVNAEIKNEDQFSNKISPILNLFLNRVSEEGGVYVRLPESLNTFNKNYFLLPE